MTGDSGTIVGGARYTPHDRYARSLAMRNICAIDAPHVQTESSPHSHVEKRMGTPVALSA